MKRCSCHKAIRKLKPFRVKKTPLGVIHIKGGYHTPESIQELKEAWSKIEFNRAPILMSSNDTEFISYKRPRIIRGKYKSLQSLKEIEKVLQNYYSHLSLQDRVSRLRYEWNRAIQVNQKLQLELNGGVDLSIG